MDTSQESKEDINVITCKSKAWRIFKKNIFLVILICGIIIGVVMGILIKVNHPDFHEDKRNVMYLAFPGDLLLRMLKCMIIPLIVSSLVAGMASIPGQASGRLGCVAVLYYSITTVLAVILGIVLVISIQPGNKGKKEVDGDENTLVQPVDAFLDLLR